MEMQSPRSSKLRLLIATVILGMGGVGLAGCSLYDNAVYGNRPGTVEQPGSGADANQPAIYVVAGGDTVESIGRKFNVPAQTIIDRNSLRPPYRIVPGQWLELPARGGGGGFVAGNDDRSAPGGNAPPGKPAAVQVQQLAPPPGAAGAGSAPPPPAMTSPPANAPTAIAPAAGSRPASPPPTQIATTAPSKFDWPLRGQIVLAFGTHSGGVQNDGINIAAAKGTPVKAAEGGTVLYAGDEVKGFGKLVLIGHADGYVTAYANNDELMVAKGKRVAKGEVIAKVGQTGNVTSPQLHFEIRQKNKPVDPTTLLGS